MLQQVKGPIPKRASVNDGKTLPPKNQGLSKKFPSAKMRAGVTGLPVRRRFGYYYLGRSSSLSVYNSPQTNSGQGPATWLNTPPSGRKGCYSSLPSKHEHTEMPPRGVGRGVPEGFMVPPIPATPGRTQPTPSASRSLGGELTGEFTSMLGT